MRIDKFLFDNGYCDSREKAKKMIAENRVQINGKTILKPSFEIFDDVGLEILESPYVEYVSRAGNKLQVALDYFKIDVKGMTAIDIGASTGGFTDCLLHNGAKKVYAIDVGKGQLHEKLRGDKRVISFEETNARNLSPSMFNDILELAVLDVSFISQTLLYPALSAILKNNAKLITLIKPQFESMGKCLSKNGIINNPKGHKIAIDRVIFEAEKHHFAYQGLTDSPFLGKEGNKEFLAYFILKK